MLIRLLYRSPKRISSKLIIMLASIVKEVG